MGLKIYLPLAFVLFLAATTGADLIARTSIAGGPIRTLALREHLYYAGVQFIGTILLLAPFVVVAFVCSRAEKQARSRSASLIFAVAMFTLLYFYFKATKLRNMRCLKGSGQPLPCPWLFPFSAARSFSRRGARRRSPRGSTGECPIRVESRHSAQPIASVLRLNDELPVIRFLPVQPGS